MDIKKVFDKYKDIIPYAVFGVLTTLVNILAYWIMAHPLNMGVMPSTIVAWVAAVFFAYVTNRKWVFHSEANSTKAIAKEIISFFVCRLATGIVDWGCMFIFVDKLHLNDVIVKTAANVLVIILNYVASKLVIFKHSKEDRECRKRSYVKTVAANRGPVTVIYNIISLLILALGCFCFGSVVILLLFFSTSRHPCSVDNYISNGWLLIPVCALLAFFSLFFIRYRDTNSVAIDKGVKISLPFIFAFQIYIFLHIFFESGWDASAIASTARLIASGDTDNDAFFWLSSSYLSKCQNNLLLALISGQLLKINSTIGIFEADYDLMSIVIVNSASSLLAAYLVYKILRILVGDSRLSLFGYILVLLLCTVSPWNVITYSDPLSLAFPALVVYIYIQPKLKTIIKWTLMIAVGYVGYKIKPTVVIIFIAIVGIKIIDYIHTILMEKKINKKDLANKMRVIAFSFFTIIFINSFLSLQYDSAGFTIDNTQKYSMYHFLMMGQNDPTNGVYYDGDVQFSDSFADYETRKAAAKDVIKERIQNRGVIGQIDFTARKVLSDFNDGSFAWAVEGAFYGVMKPELTKASSFFRNIYYSDGANYKAFKITTQFCWWLVILLMLVSVVCEIVRVLKEKTTNRIYLVLLSALIGISMYDAIFETRARYLYIYVPIFVICAIYGLSSILDRMLPVIGTQSNTESESSDIINYKRINGCNAGREKTISRFSLITRYGFIPAMLGLTVILYLCDVVPGYMQLQDELKTGKFIYTSDTVDVLIGDNKKMYYVTKNGNDNTKAFYLHYYTDHPGVETSSTVVNNDFAFFRYEMKLPFWYKNKVAVRKFPENFTIDRIETGQYENDTNIWGTEYSAE